MNLTPVFWKAAAVFGLLLPFTVAGQTQELKTPKVPGRNFTNSVGMVFVKIGDYWAGRYEVTQKQFQEVMGSNPSAFRDDDHPVDNLTWNDAMEFCRRITASAMKDLELPTGFKYSLPTEGQWDSWASSVDLKDAVTSENGTRTGTERIGTLGPNAQGLYDVRGNVMEFCAEADKPYRILKGGSWQDRIEINLRTNFRFYVQPDQKGNTFGFRCILTGP